MRGLGDTIRHLNALHDRLVPGAPTAPSDRLVPVPEPRADPGNLHGWCHVPAGAIDMPLVVVLHGCTQTAAAYDQGSGWSQLAERHGFAVLFPEQQRANNPNLCFNWFSPGDVRRGSGEVESIRAMIAAMVDRHPIDPARIYVTGLSAGGAMTAAMLACYPELFAGGAIVAGLPYGAAASVPEALERMRGQGHARADEAARRIAQASGHAGRWPMLSVWHGTADATVTVDNAEAILAQWQALTGLSSEPDRREIVDGAVHRVWLGRDGEPWLEDYRVPGLGHGTPIATAGATASGTPGPHMLAAGISSPWHSAVRWGLIDPAAAPVAEPRPVAGASPPPAPPAAPAPIGVQATIEAALRQAGLLR